MMQAAQDGGELTLLRQELEKFGISTKTPGLKGEQRLHALRQRLLEHKSAAGSQDGQKKLRKASVSSMDAVPEESDIVVPAEVQSMSMTDIRRELEERGLDTRTPGLGGEPRRQALAARLASARAVKSRKSAVVAKDPADISSPLVPALLKKSDNLLVQSSADSPTLQTEGQFILSQEPGNRLGNRALPAAGRTHAVPTIWKRAIPPPPSAPKSSGPDADIVGKSANFHHIVSKDFDKAEDLYKKALQINPNHAVNLSNFALFLQHIRKKMDDAETHFLRAYNANPKLVSNITNYANFLKKFRRDHDKAEEFYRLGIAADPKHASNLGNYALFMKQVRKDLFKSDMYFRQAIESDPQHANNLGAYAGLLKKVGRFDDAEKFYIASLKVNPGNANVLGNYANFLKQQKKDFAQAKELYLQALKADPNNPMVARNYCIFLRDCPHMRKGTSKSVPFGPKTSKKFDLDIMSTVDEASSRAERSTSGNITARSSYSVDSASTLPSARSTGTNTTTSSQTPTLDGQVTKP